LNPIRPFSYTVHHWVELKECNGGFKYILNKSSLNGNYMQEYHSQLTLGFDIGTGNITYYIIILLQASL
jgi:hypothetical protein